MRIHLIAAYAFAALALRPGVVAADEHRELGPHVHGHGTLDIAIEDKHVSMELEVPGMDIAGFEHAPSTNEQKAVVEKAKADLEKPFGLFLLPPAAQCSVADAKVAIEPEHHHDGDDDDHDHADKADAKDDDHDHDHDHEGHAGHNQFHVNYELTCNNPGELAAITFDYFTRFAGAHDLTVNVVTAKGQSKYEVSRDKPVLDLAGIM
jgi:uncharacterized protein DUF2796